MDKKFDVFFECVEKVFVVFIDLMIKFMFFEKVVNDVVKVECEFFFGLEEFEVY